MRTLQHVNLTFLYQKFISLENILFGTLPVSTQCSKKKKIKTLKKKIRSISYGDPQSSLSTATHKGRDCILLHRQIKDPTPAPDAARNYRTEPQMVLIQLCPQPSIQQYRDAFHHM